MANASWMIEPKIADYMRAVTLREPPVLARLRAYTQASVERAGMQIAPEQGQFMALLVRLIGARQCLEIGTYTGYSSTALALALPDDGRLVCCDVSEAWTDVARRAWEEAGVAHKIELRLAPAVDTLAALTAAGARFDLAFIDADKESYDAYYEGSLKLVRPGGLILINNVLWSGAVADPDDRSPLTEAVRALNAKIARDERVRPSMLPIGDGLTLAQVVGAQVIG